MPKLGANAPTEESVTMRAREPKTLLDTMVQYREQLLPESQNLQQQGVSKLE
jgi:hypothetical protein